jgi:CubicO group peptidase (beta-lactamase class C family)
MNHLYISIVVSVIFLTACEGDKTYSEHSLLVEFADSLFITSVDSSLIAGASVIVYQNGKMLLDKSYGHANLELSVQMPDDASFEIGSVTKQFTAAAILKLADKGKLSLDDDFTKYLQFDTKGRTISINQLLNHTSGIPSYTELPEFEDIMAQSYARDTLLRIVEQHDFLFEPGEAMIYNNSAYFFLGLIIEKITERTYEEYLREEFFDPLGMKNTYYSSTSKVIPNRAFGYSYTDSGLSQKQYIDYTWPYSAGSLSSTTDDLLVWMRALHEGKVFNEELYNALISPGKLNDGVIIRYAMGLVNYLNFGHREIGHGGGIPGFLSATKYFPEEDLYIICLVNTMGPKGAEFFADELTWKLLEKYGNDPLEVDINLDSLEGRYTGQIRGQIISVDIEAQPKSLIISTEGRSQADTLDIYLGNNTWGEGNSLIRIDDNVYSRDDIYGYFKLAKER